MRDQSGFVGAAHGWWNSLERIHHGHAAASEVIQLVCRAFWPFIATSMRMNRTSRSGKPGTAFAFAESSAGKSRSSVKVASTAVMGAHYVLADPRQDQNTIEVPAAQPARVAQMQALLEKLITDGRSTPTTPQQNNVKVKRYPAKPRKGK